MSIEFVQVLCSASLKNVPFSDGFIVTVPQNVLMSLNSKNCFVIECIIYQQYLVFF